MAKIGRWRQRSREVIAEVLRFLPADADEKACRAAVSAAYPFGERQHHPYRAWLAEVKLAMADRFGAKQKAKEPAPTVEYRITPADFAGVQLLLYVKCGWCNFLAGRECMMCYRQRQKLSAVEADKDVVATQTAARDGDPVALAALGDLLEERLGGRLGL